MPIFRTRMGPKYGPLVSVFILTICNGLVNLSFISTLRRITRCRKSSFSQVSESSSEEPNQYANDNHQRPPRGTAKCAPLYSRPSCDAKRVLHLTSHKEDIEVSTIVTNGVSLLCNI